MHRLARLLRLLADRLDPSTSTTIHIPVYLDGKVIAENVVKHR